MISLEILNILIPLQKMLKNVADLGKLIVAKALKSCPKSNISPNLVTLHSTANLLRSAPEGCFSAWRNFLSMQYRRSPL